MHEVHFLFLDLGKTHAGNFFVFFNLTVSVFLLPALHILQLEFKAAYTVLKLEALIPKKSANQTLAKASRLL